MPKYAKYSEAGAQMICDMIIEGKTMAQIAVKVGISQNMIHRWCIMYPKFGQAFKAARELSAYMLEEKALGYADDLVAPNDFTGTKVRAYEVAMNQLRWSASKRNKSEFGQDTTAVSIVPIQINTTLDLGQGSGVAKLPETPYNIQARITNDTPVEDAEEVDETNPITVPPQGTKRFTLKEPSKRPNGRPPGYKYKSDARIQETISKRENKRLGTKSVQQPDGFPDDG